MRSFGALALRQVRARPLRALLTTAGIALGVGMVMGVLLLSATIRGTFTDLFDSIYGETDIVVAGRGASGSMPASTLGRVRRVDGVAEVSANVTDVFTLLDSRGRPRRGPEAHVNVAGVKPGALGLTGGRRVAGRAVRSGSEVTVLESWAQSNRIEVGERIRLATPSGVARFRVVGLFDFQAELNFGGQGFVAIPIALARRLMDKRGVYDEIQVVVQGGGPEAVQRVKRRLRRELGRGVNVVTPLGRSQEIDEQLESFDVILVFFAGMALFVGGFLIFNAFNMTVLQRTREIGMLRTIGATRAMIVRSVLREAVLVGAVGIALGLGLGVLLAQGLIELLRQLEFPVGGLDFDRAAPIAALVTGLFTTALGALAPARRAGRLSPIRAVLGVGERREPPGPRRAAAGLTLVALGGAGAFWLAAAPTASGPIVAAGLGGVVALFLGIALVAPFAISPLVRMFSWPVRRLRPVEGRLAADSAAANPRRTAATATALTIGLALVVAFGTLGSSFLNSISGEFDRNFARDLTVQPTNYVPGGGPQQTIAAGLRQRIQRLPEAAVVARERFLYLPELPGPRGGKRSDGLLIAFDPKEYRHIDKTEIVGASRRRVFKALESGAITVGEGYTDESGLRRGDTVTLAGPSGRRRARVAGIVRTTVFGGATIGMSLRTLREVWGINANTELAIKATSDATRDELERGVERIVRRDYPNLVVLSNDELKDSISEQINRQFGFFNAILGVAVIVSLFGIINTLSMSVIERTRELGVLRALGATRWQVRRSVVYESLMIALAGAVIGIVVGAALGWVILTGLAHDVPGVSWAPPIPTIAAVAVAAVVLGLLAAILPARRAARLNVIDALSYE